MQPQNSPAERINPELEEGQSSGRFKSLTVLVSSDTDTSELEGHRLSTEDGCCLRQNT